MFRRVFIAAALSAALIPAGFVTAANAATIGYSASLSGAKEVPKTTSKGTGKLDASLDTTTKVLSYTLTFDGLTGPATVAHFHGPATRTVNAGVIAMIGDKNPTSPVTGTVTLTEDQLKELQTGKFYVNVHTAANPGGEIRGQVTRVRAMKKTAAKTTT